MVTNNDLYERYRISLRGVLRERKKLTNQVKYRKDDLDFCASRNYRIELLNVIASNLRLVLCEVDGRYVYKNHKLNPLFYRWDL